MYSLLIWPFYDWMQLYRQYQYFVSICIYSNEKSCEKCTSCLGSCIGMGKPYSVKESTPPLSAFKVVVLVSV